MIPIKSVVEIKKMQLAGQALKKVFESIAPYMRAGVTTFEIDKIAEETILSLGAKAPCKGYYGYPCATCISIDEVVVHGIPSMRTLKAGEIVSVDIVLQLNGYCSDAARTYTVGNVSDEKSKLIDVAQKAFWLGVNEIKHNAPLGNVKNAIQMATELNGFSVIRAMTGHGIGKSMHEDPAIPNYGQRGAGPILKKGMCLAIEPMISAGTWEVEIDKLDGWTCRTKDRRPSAHYENTVLVTESGFEVLTV